jgi:Leucine-rich repeat (LRR) protein
LSSLEYLWLYNNTLTGPIPTQLGTLSSLEEIWLSNNKLTGQIPSELGLIQTLDYLWLYGNPGLNATIPLEINQTQVDVRFEKPIVSQSPSARPSQSPSQSPSLSRRTTLSNLFVSYNVSIEDLETLSSPQYLALDWMADEDSIDLQAELSDYELVERFVLVVIYYATGGATWLHNRANFLDSSSKTCLWKDDGSGRGVGCNEEGSVVILVLSKFPNSSTISFLNFAPARTSSV